MDSTHRLCFYLDESTKVFKEEAMAEDVEDRVCTACLCATRTTHKLHGVMLKCYMDILTETQLLSDTFPAPRVCWECRSVLKRWSIFREQAKQSFAVLHSARQRCDQKDINKFLVSRVSRPGRLVCCFSGSVDICPGQNDANSEVMTAARFDDDHAVDDYKQLPTVKKEVEHEMEIPVNELIEDNSGTTIFIEPLKTLECEYSDDSKERAVLYSQCKERPKGNKLRSRTGQKQDKCELEKLLSHKSRSDKNVEEALMRLREEKPFPCSQCPAGFMTEKQLKRHVNTHRTDKPHRCHLCRKSFVKANSLRAHLVTHTDPSVKLPFKCEVCMRPFNNENNCIRHEKTHCSEAVNRKSAKVECELCKRTLCNKATLKTHMLWHTRESNWKCDVCQRLFVLKAMLNEHRLRAHSHAKPFQCEMCPKAYKIKTELSNHLLSHADIKQFQCNECLKLFSTKKYLRIHLETHSDKKPFQCDVCLKFFKTKYSRMLHQITHTGEKPFQCEVCEKAFNTKKHMRRHQVVHTQERPFQCTVCSNTYARKDYLLVHMRAHSRT